MDRKVVITGLGIVSPLGCELTAFWRRLCEGQSGIGTIGCFDTSLLPVHIAGEVKEFNVEDFVPKKTLRRTDPFCHYAIGAAKLAVTDAGLDMANEDPNRCGVIVGSGVGGLSTLEAQYRSMIEKNTGKCSAFMIPQMIVNMAAGNVAIELGMRGPNYAAVSACATALHCIGGGSRMIQRGEADVVVAGGAEAAVCFLGVSGFSSLKALSRRNDDPEKASRPFETDRDGFVMSNGGAIVVMEAAEHAAKRGADVYCEAAGMGQTCDAYHMTAPAEGGEGAARAMKLAISDAGLNLDEVDYINAHGTSTQLNDRAETAAIKAAFTEEGAKKLMVSSSKSMTGHLLGAAGGIETAICALAIKYGVVPPTINYETPDPVCDLDYVPNTAREAKIKACINNSLGFGGHNACLAMKAVE